MTTLNDTPSADRAHIGFFGVRNAGKSSLINAVTGQDLAVVSDVAGTTTDPVRKAMELLPAGPVLIIDTPGIDDEGALGEKRVKKTRRVLNSVDVAVLAVDATRGLVAADTDLIALFVDKHIPAVIALTKCDLADQDTVDATRTRVDEVLKSGKDGKEVDACVVTTSASNGEGIHELKETIARIALRGKVEHPIVRDLLDVGDSVVLVCPIDESAPKGRLILPQQQTIRDVLEAGAHAIVTKETELEQSLAALAKPPRMVITDSQVFGLVAEIVPESIPLTSFSILMARYKGTLDAQVEGANELERMHLNPGSIEKPHLLIAEGCTHHRQCEDIGTVKLPRWISEYLQAEVDFDFCSGGDYPEDMSSYDVVVHCGGCMVNEREMLWRARHASSQGIPFTNYGILIAKMNGILDRSLAALEKCDKGTGHLS